MLFSSWLSSFRSVRRRHQSCPLAFVSLERTVPLRVERLEARLNLSTFTESEPNDSSGTADLVTIATGDVLTAVASDWLNVSGNISSTSDLDFFQFTVSTRSGVFFDIDSRETGLSTVLDSKVTVFDASQTVMGSNDDGYDFDTGFPAPFFTAGASSADSSLYLDLTPGTYTVQVNPSSGSGSYVLRMLADSNYSATVPVFDSRSGAADTLYLDFDGHSATDDWNNQQPYVINPFDISGSGTEFTPAEKLLMKNVWRIIGEDFSPFNINISTLNPGSFNDAEAFRQVIGNSNGSEVGEPTSTLGVAFLDSYAGSAVNTAFTFASNFSSFGGGVSGQLMAMALEMGNTSSHEFGHALGLGHYTTSNSGAASSVGIMFTPDSGLNRELWYRAKNENDVIQDDRNIISNTTNSFGYAPDDYGIFQPTHNQGFYKENGIIAAQLFGDGDNFRFVGSGPTTVTVDVDEYTSNLDAYLEIQDVDGNTIASSASDTDGYDVSITLNLTQGIYFAVVGGTEIYPRYSAGQYTLTITTTPNRLPVVTLTAPAVTNDSTPLVTVQVSDPDGTIANGTTVRLDLDRNNDGDFDDPGEVNSASGTTVGGSATFSISPALADRTYGVRARVSDQFGEEGVSAVSTMIVDTVKPTANIVDVTPDPRINEVGFVTITFSEDVMGFSASDLTLTRNGNPVDLTGVAFAQVNPDEYDEYTVDLAPFTIASGNYVLTLNSAGSGIQDAATNPLLADAVDAFEINRGPTDITLSNNSVPENTDTSSPLTVGNVVVTDDGQGTLVLAITGGADAAAFQLSGNQLQFVAGSVLNFEAQTSYLVSITVTDDTHTLTRDLTVLVTNVNENPVAVDDQIQLLEGGTVITLVGGATKLTSNDTDPDLPNDTLTATVVSGPTHGTLQLNPDGTFQYQHDDTEILTDSFSYKITDLGGLFSIATVAISVTAVNEFAPTVGDENLLVAEGGTVNVTTAPSTNLLANDFDADSPNDAISIETQPFAQPAHGTVTIFANGAFSYVHSGDESTSDQFRYLVRDTGGHSTIGTVNITITPVNDTPIARADTIEVPEGGTATQLLNGATSVLANDSDAETLPAGMTLTVVTPPTRGDLVLNSNGTFSYQHLGSETLTDSFEYRLTDPAGAFSLATVSIRIIPVNDNTPVAINDSAAVQQGGSIFSLIGGAVSVTKNDTDTDLPFDSFTVTPMSSPTNGSLTLGADGSFYYTHNGTKTATDSFTYKLTDAIGNVSNTATVSISIKLINEKPVASASGPYILTPGTDLVLNGAGSNDPDGDSLTYRWDIKGDGIIDVTTSSSTATVPWSTLVSSGLVSGVTTVKLEVRDPSGLSSLATTTLQIGSTYQFSPTADGTPDDYIVSTINGSLDIRKVGTLTNLVPAGLTAITSVNIVGSSDNETFLVQSPSRTLSFFVDGNGGDDIVKVQGTALADTLAVSSLAGRILVAKTTGTPFYVSSTAETVCVLGSDGADTLDARQVLAALTSLQLLGENGNDTLAGGLGNDAFVGGDGTDLLSEVGPGNLTLTDTQLIGHGTDTIDVSIEAIKLTGDAGNNLFDASAFTRFGVHLDGAAGDDILLGGSKSDSLVGGDGTDEVRQAVSKDAKLTTTQLMQGTAQSTSPFTILTPATDGLSSIERVKLTGNTLVNRLDATSFTGATTLDGGAANDTLIGGSGADLILGGADNDSLLGNGGNDTIGGGTGNDKIDGGVGNDGLAGQDGNDTIIGGADNDTLLGGAGNDSLRGGAGRDLIQGGTGKDNINGEGDVDTVMGGSGGGPDSGDKVFDPIGEVNESFKFTLDWLNLI